MTLQCLIWLVQRRIKGLLDAVERWERLEKWLKRGVGRELGR